MFITEFTWVRRFQQNSGFKGSYHSKNFFIQKLCKINKKNCSSILRVYLLSPTSFILIFILATFKQIHKNSLFWGALEWYDPLRGHSGEINIFLKHFHFVVQKIF